MMCSTKVMRYEMCFPLRQYQTENRRVFDVSGELGKDGKRADKSVVEWESVGLGAGKSAESSWSHGRLTGRPADWARLVTTRSALNSNAEDGAHPLIIELNPCSSYVNCQTRATKPCSTAMSGQSMHPEHLHKSDGVHFYGSGTACAQL
jgi:hypothetical protein